MREAGHITGSRFPTLTAAASLAHAGLMCLWLGACADATPRHDSQTLKLASTYSLDQSGLFAELSPLFTRRTGYRLVPAFVGSGKALDLAREGKADVVWVHSRPLEDAFVGEGYGINRVEVMADEYVLVGPQADPAHIAGLTSAVDALKRIREAGGTFISRGDGSGTHARELALWDLAGIDPRAGAYIPLHAGTLSVLRKASEIGGYTLSDHPTFLMHHDALQLTVLVRGDSRLQNPYSILAVSPSRSPNVNYPGAMALVDFVIDEDTQERIANFGHDQFAARLFHPLARPEAGE